MSFGEAMCGGVLKFEIASPHGLLTAARAGLDVPAGIRCFQTDCASFALERI